MKDVQTLAKEAGFEIVDNMLRLYMDGNTIKLGTNYTETIVDGLKNFAAIIREDEREACIDDVRCVGGKFAIEAEQIIRARGE